MKKKDMIAMLLAGGQGSRLGVLTRTMAKPAVSFGGKYRIIDFPLSNCINSGIDTVGVLTQYQPLRLNAHIGIGIPWDLDRNFGGVTILAPHETIVGSDWYSGTANAIYQNIDYIDNYNPEYVLILSGDHIYKMDYEVMLSFHKANQADLTVAAIPVPWEEAGRYGLVVCDENGKIKEFQEKPAEPHSNLASMGIYIFNYKLLRQILIEMKNVPNLDFGMHVIPRIKDSRKRIFAYEFHDYWRDVGTLSSYWKANMELADIVPEFNLYEEHWKIYTKTDDLKPHYIAENVCIERALISSGCIIRGNVKNSVLGEGVVIEEGAEVTDSIIMSNTHIGKNTKTDKAIIAERVKIGKGCVIGSGEYAESEYDRKVYQSDLAVVAEGSVIPDNITIGRNTAVDGKTAPGDYPEGRLNSGKVIIKEECEL